MIGIDWVSAAILGVALIVSQIRAVPVAVRNWALAAACFAIAGWRLRNGAQGINLVFVGVAALLGITYAVNALRGPKHPR